jgi:hypothetical protein
VGAPCDDGGVDAVRGVESKDVAALPVPEGFQALAELDGTGLDLGECVGAKGLRVDVYFLGEMLAGWNDGR